MKKLMILTILAAAVGALASCGEGKKAHGIDVANLDRSVNPADDFYHFTNGGWMAKNPLKPEYSRFGAFDKLGDDNLNHLKSIVDELSAANNQEGTNAYKIATLYSLGMDSTRLNAEGATPVKAQLEIIRAIKTPADFTKMVAELHHQGTFPYFMSFVSGDEKNSAMNIVMLQQGGLGMGQRDYYLEDSHKQLVEAYKTYIEKLFTLAGYTPAQAKEAVAAVIKIENKIAAAHYTKEDLRNSNLNYNKMAIADLPKISRLVDWKTYFNELGLGSSKEVNVRQKNVYPALDKALRGVTMDEHKYYLAFNLLSDAASYLSDDFSDASFEFYGKEMSGRMQKQTRWKRALSTTDNALSEAMGQLYVERYFPASSKTKMLELVGNLENALAERINRLEWMSAETKDKARQKLAAFTVKIGYPDTWRDYADLQIDSSLSYWENIRRANIFEMEYMYADADKPVDKSRWLMSPQTVNAYYNPTTNEICFPAAILQPPFFDPAADDAVNYGAIGVVIGHEMTHGFDDQGRNYDKDGNLVNWWTDEDAQKFNSLADKLVEQFNAIEVAPGVFANGRYTLGENIADQGGLLVAREAYENTITGTQRPVAIDGFTDVQRFYLGYATVWGQNLRPEEVVRLTQIDVHSLGEYRVNATLRNIDDFYTAFDVQEDNKMYLKPEDRVIIW